MKKILIYAFTMLILTFQFLLAEQKVLENGDIIFETPEGFTPLTPDEIKLKYPSVYGPNFVVGNELRNTTVAYELKATGMPPDKHVDSELPNLQKGVAQTMERLVPGIKWLKNEIVEINGNKWVYFEFTSNAIDQDIHNMMLMTFYKGKMFIVNFNSTKSRFEEAQKDLRRCIQTLKVRK